MSSSGFGGRRERDQDNATAAAQPARRHRARGAEQTKRKKHQADEEGTGAPKDQRKNTSGEPRRTRRGGGHEDMKSRQKDGQKTRAPARSGLKQTMGRPRSVGLSGAPC